MFLYFNRPEFDRYSRFNSWSSARETFTWEDMCDMEIELPPISIQQKYVDVYNAMVENQKAYEMGLSDLKLTCEAYIEDLRRKIPSTEIGEFLEKRVEKNSNERVKQVLGISKDGFIDPKVNMDGISLTNYNIFYKNDFVYSPPRINIGSIGLYNVETPSICSPIYNVFYVKNSKKLIPEYLEIWFKRNEFLRSTDFYSIGSVRNNFSIECMFETKIPIPDISIQKSIANIYNSYTERKQINELLKQQIKDICPILIKGSIEEGK